MLTKIKNKREVAKVFKEFSEVLDVVYFGAITDKDDIEPVKGFTFTPVSKDNHYMHGNYDGFNVTSLLRTNTIERPGLETETFTWSILKIDMQRSGFPHFVLTSHRFSKMFFENLHLKYPKLKNSTELFRTINPSFADVFKVYSSLEDSNQLFEMMTDMAMQTLYMQFPRYEFEINDDSLIVYYQGEANIKQLREMLAAATWLTEHTEYALSYD